MLQFLTTLLFGESLGESQTPAGVLNQAVHEARLHYQRMLRTALVPEMPAIAGRLSEALTGYVFDFGEFGFHSDENIDFKEACRQYLDRLASFNLIPQEKLSVHLVHRASRVDINIEVFEEHMKELVRFDLIVAGPRAPATAFSLPQHKPYFDRLKGIDVDEAKNMKGQIAGLKTELAEVTSTLEELTGKKEDEVGDATPNGEAAQAHAAEGGEAGGFNETGMPEMPMSLDMPEPTLVAVDPKGPPVPMAQDLPTIDEILSANQKSGSSN